MRIRPLIVAGVAVALTGLLAACGTSASSPTTTAGSPAAAGVEMMDAGMGSTDDITFAQLMIPHHQQAIEMADLALAQASSPDVASLATQIKGAQDPEIAMMSQWLSAWDAPMAMESDHSGHDMGGMMSSGMMSDDDMSELASASGEDFDQMWLRMMIAHHEGAIEMAKQVLATTTNPAVRDLAQAVIDGQTAEIDTMNKLVAP